MKLGRGSHFIKICSVNSAVHLCNSYFLFSMHVVTQQSKTFHISIWIVSFVCAASECHFEHVFVFYFLYFPSPLFS